MCTIATQREPGAIAGLSEGRAENLSGLLWVIGQPCAEVFLDGLPDAAAHLGVAKRSARAALELGKLQLHRDDRRQPRADRVRADVGIRCRQQPSLPRIRRERARYSITETQQMRAALGRGPGIGEAANLLRSDATPVP